MEGSVGFNDRLSSLPDKILHRIMSFLPAQEAVRTCLLSARWRHLWESLPCLRVHAVDFPNKKAFTRFMNFLLLCRGPEPLDSFYLSVSSSIDPIDLSDVDLWIFDVLSMEVKVLHIDLDHPRGLHLDPFIFTMSFLRVIHLGHMNLSEELISQMFSCCKLLEDMCTIHCIMQTRTLKSDSLKKLKMAATDACGSSVGVYENLSINMPALTLLHLDARGCRVPLLDEVSAVERVSIILDEYSLADDCNLIQALANTMDLEILAPGINLQFLGLLGRDLAHCYVFSKLKALSLDDWCLVLDCKALLSFLADSPLLEKLSLTLSKLSLKMVELAETCFQCEHLKFFKVIYKEGDARVCDLMRLLSHIAPYLVEIVEIKLRLGSGARLSYR